MNGHLFFFFLDQSMANGLDIFLQAMSQCFLCESGWVEMRTKALIVHT